MLQRAHLKELISFIWRILHLFRMYMGVVIILLYWDKDLEDKKRFGFCVPYSTDRNVYLVAKVKHQPVYSRDDFELSIKLVILS